MAKSHISNEKDAVEGGCPDSPASDFSDQKAESGVLPQSSYVAASVPSSMPGSDKATGALICGILAIVFSGTVIIGVVLGIIAIVFASRYVHSFGKDGKATAGTATGIAGIVFSVIALIAYVFIVVGLFSLAPMMDDGDFPIAADVSVQQELDASATEALDALVYPDDAALQETGDMIAAGFLEGSGYALSEIGIEPAAFAEWSTAGASYQVDSVLQLSSETGIAYATVERHDTNEFITILMTDVQAFASSEEAAALPDEASAKAAVGSLTKTAMEKTGMSSTSIYFDLVKEDGTWKVSPDSLDSAKRVLFGLV